MVLACQEERLLGICSSKSHPGRFAGHHVSCTWCVPDAVTRERLPAYMLFGKFDMPLRAMFDDFSGFQGLGMSRRDCFSIGVEALT